MFYSSGKNGDSPTNNSNGTENSANGSSTLSGAGQCSNPIDKDSNATKATSKTPKEKQDPLGYPLHECVFRGDVKELSALIRAGNDLSKVDPHGNSALHLAVMLGRRECVHLLCAHGAPVKIKNKQGWSPIAEAIRYFINSTIIAIDSRAIKFYRKDFV